MALSCSIKLSHSLETSISREWCRSLLAILQFLVDFAGSKVAPLSVAVILVLSQFVGDGAFADERLVPTSRFEYRKQHAVIVGINYDLSSRRGMEGYIQPLDGAEGDAQAVSDILEKEYGYQKNDIKLLLGRDASLRKIKECFEFLHKNVKEDDSVLFYFAGHGSSVETASGKNTYGTVYPVDVRVGEDDQPYITSCLRIEEDVVNYLEKDCLARHKLLILDSCHSGEVLRIGGFRSGPPKEHVINRKRFSEQSFQAIASAGHNEKALDSSEDGHSPFTSTLITALREGPVGNSQFIAASDLIYFIPKRMQSSQSDQTSSGGPLSGSGDFYFFRHGKGPAQGMDRAVVGSSDSTNRNSAPKLSDEDSVSSSISERPTEDTPEPAHPASGSSTDGKRWIGVIAACSAAGICLLLLVRHRRHHTLAFTPDERRLQKTVFPSLSTLQFKALMDIAEWRALEPNTQIVECGTTLEGLYLICSGSAEVRKSNKFVAQLEEGQFIGEMSFCKGGAATADVIALAPLCCVFWPKAKLYELFSHKPKLMEAFQERLGQDIEQKSEDRDTGATHPRGALEKRNRSADENKRSSGNRRRRDDDGTNTGSGRTSFFEGLIGDISRSPQGNDKEEKK